MSDLDTARDLLGLEEKWLQPFDEVDPFNGLPLRGFVSLKPDHRYGALAITHVDGRPAPQRIFGTPKLHFPFDRQGNFHFPPVARIAIYEKLDGTNVLAYCYRDAGGATHTTFKLRLAAVLRNSKWGPFLDMWREILARHPVIPELPAINDCAVSFELYGSRNPHLMLYDVPLDCALLFGVANTGAPIPPDALDGRGVAVPRCYGVLDARADPVAEFARLRAEIETGIESLEDEKLKGSEGAVWYVTAADRSIALFKCKPESVESIHWKAGINKAAVAATCWNLLETQDVLTYDALLPLLLEEYEAAEIARFRANIEAVIGDVEREMTFRAGVMEAYRKTGLSIAADKGAVMRELSKQFPRNEMKRVYSIILHETG